MKENDCLKRKTILIVDDQPDFRATAADRLSRKGFEILQTTDNPLYAIELIKSKQPDIVLFDVILSQLDGLAFLKEAFALRNGKTHYIAASSVASAAIIKEIMKLGAEYYLIKPFDFDILCERINQICANEEFTQQKEESTARVLFPHNEYTTIDLERRVTDISLEIGIPAHVKGYHYVRSAIILSVEQPDVINAVTKIIYPTIAKQYQTSSSRVERAIRHAIEVAWDRGNVDTLNSIFGYSISSNRGKPTNSEFIAMIADRLRLESRPKQPVVTY